MIKLWLVMLYFVLYRSLIKLHLVAAGASSLVQAIRSCCWCWWSGLVTMSLMLAVRSCRLCVVGTVGLYSGIVDSIVICPVEGEWNSSGFENSG